jgi:Phytanoyl-CoA dioxygenase (PhyH)
VEELRASGQDLQMKLEASQLREFGERGYLLVPGVVSLQVVAEARRAVAQLLTDRPPPVGHRGGQSYWLEPIPEGPLLAPLLATRAFAVAGSLVGPDPLDAPEALQVALNIPWHTHHPGGPHIDGLTPPERDGRPGTFTLLAGIFLTDQPEMEMGNVWMWPGSHRQAAAHLHAVGSDRLMDAAVRYPPVPLASPVAVLGHAGDLLLAHYLCGHNSSGNESRKTREVLYFRLRCRGHRARWRQCVTDALHEFDPVRAVLESGAA